MTLTMIDGPSGKIATYCAATDTKPTLVFVHGDSARASQWDAVIVLLGQKVRSISYDGRGHGASDQAQDGIYTYAARAADLASVVRHYALRDYIVVAHSGAAGAVLEYATKATNLTGIFLVEPATDPQVMSQDTRDGFVAALAGPDALSAIQGYYASIAGPDPTIIAQVQQDAATTHKAARLDLAKALADWNPEPTLTGYTGPIASLITAPNDTDAALYHLHSNMAHKVTSTPGHWPHLDTPQTVADEIMTFIMGLDSK